MKKAYFAGGCFWCIQPVFDALDGVEATLCGYCGGEEADASYEKVKAQETLHRETMEIGYDPEKISYARLLETFLANVDPFDGGGQFIDRGRSYTLAVYCADAAERAEAEKALAALGARTGREPCVSLETLGAFYPAEEYHQKYYEKNPEAFAREMEESGRKR